MKQRERMSIPERLGRLAGKAVRNYRRIEARLLEMMRKKGIPNGIGVTLLWVIKLLIVGGLLYIAFWLALILFFVVVAARLSLVPMHDEEEWAIGEQADHKDSVFYDPINYTDTPDPRFDDELDR